jgi:SpoVK/Ycf46/Vps4 family AAA+-type ATPase
MEKAKELIHDNIILALTKPELLRAYGKKLGLGAIFYGPPGCGKTYIVSAIAGETHSKFIIARINEIVDMYAGNTEKNMHAIFKQARENAPCIIFFDEVDALGTKREGEQQSTMRMAVNQFLQELDGVEKNPEGLFVIGATNQPWDMDPALKRPGRFGEAVYMPAPNYKERKEACRYNTRKMPLGRMINFGRLARATMGWSQADIAEVCDKTALRVAAEVDRTGKRRKIKMGDFIAIIKKKSSSLDEWYGMVKKEVISKTETQIVEGKKQTIVKEGKLTPEEKARYKPMVKDIKKNLNPVRIFIKKFIRNFAIYLF